MSNDLLRTDSKVKKYEVLLRKKKRLYNQNIIESVTSISLWKKLS